MLKNHHSLDSNAYVEAHLDFSDRIGCRGRRFLPPLIGLAQIVCLIWVLLFSVLPGWAVDYSIVYNANGGTGTIADGAKVHGVDATLSDGSGFTRAGYMFAGWAANPAGGIVAWGKNDFGQSTVPSTLSAVSAIAAGAYHSVVLKQDGSVASWGHVDGGTPLVPQGLTGVTGIVAEGYKTVALKADGTVVGWGRFSYGTSIPSGLKGVTAISLGGLHTAAIMHGMVVVWGDNSIITEVPPGLTGVTAIAAGYKHTLALKQDGTLAVWGYNTFGASTPPSGLDGVTAIAAGYYHCLALKQDGTVVAWGDNSSGQSTVPEGLSGVTAIAAKSNHSVALKRDGTVVAWGKNYYGQSNVPTGLTGVTAVATGGDHVLAHVLTYSGGAQYQRDADVVLYAMWDKVSYSIAYDTNGGSGMIPLGTKAYDEPFTLDSGATLGRVGYTFDGWNTAADGSGTSYPGGFAYAQNEGLTVYAQWAADQPVIYRANGGMGTIPEAVKHKGVDLVLADGSGFSKPGFAFDGWNTAADGSGTAYSGKTKYSGSGALVLYAQWAADLPVVYQANGGIGTIPSGMKRKGVILILSDGRAFSRPGYLFVGWNTAADGGGTAYPRNGGYSQQAAITLHAQWVVAYAVTYNANGGSGVIANQVKGHGMDHYLSSGKRLYRNGYTFAGWNTAADGSGTSYPSQAAYAVDAPLSLYAQWALNGSYAAEGGAWMTLPGLPPALVPGGINAVTLFQGEPVAVGTFTSIGGEGIETVAQWNGASWVAMGNGLGGIARGVVAAQGRLFVAGSLTLPNGHWTSLAQWDGSAWSTVPDAPRTAGSVLAADGTLVYVVALDGGRQTLHVWNGTAMQSLPDGPFADVVGLAASQEHIFVHNATSLARLLPGATTWEQTTPGTVTCLGAINKTGYAGKSVGGNEYTVPIAEWFPGSTSPSSSSPPPLEVIHYSYYSLPKAITARESDVVVMYGDGGGSYQNSGWSAFPLSPIYAMDSRRLSADVNSVVVADDSRVALLRDGVWTVLGQAQVEQRPAIRTFATLTDGTIFAATESQIFKLGDSGWQEVTASGGAIATLVAGGERLYATGQFTTLDGVALTEGGCWDGTSWTSLAMGAAGIKPPLAWYGGELLGVTEDVRLAAWTVNGWVARTPALVQTDSTGAYSSSYPPPSIRDMQVRGSSLVVCGRISGDATGGQFSSGFYPRGFARWDGTSWSALAAPVAAPLAKNTARILVATYEYEYHRLALNEEALYAVKYGSSYVNGSTSTEWSLERIWPNSGKLLGLGAANLPLALVGHRLVVGGSNLSILDGSSLSPFCGGTDGPVQALLATEKGLLVAGGFNRVGLTGPGGGLPVNGIALLVPVDLMVTRFYRECLSRDPDSTGLASWTNALVGKTQSGADVARGFVLSQEFANRNLSDEAYLVVLYKAFFNRAPDSGGLALWKAELARGVLREDVLYGFTGAQEFANLCNAHGIVQDSAEGLRRLQVRAFVRRNYQHFLGREPDAGGINGWVQALLDGTQTGGGVARGFGLSQEFINRGTTDDQFLDITYRAFFDRAADPGGKSGWLTYLGQNHLRAEVLTGFIVAQEFINLCAKYGIVPFAVHG